MRGERAGPGDDDGRPCHRKPATTEHNSSNTTSRLQTAGSGYSTAARLRQPFDPLAANARSFAAGRRMVPISECGCIRNPGVDRHACGTEITDKMAEAAVTAITHLDELGTPGLLDPDTCRAMHRVGHRALAFKVYRRSTGAA